jgi:integrase
MSDIIVLTCRALEKAEEAKNPVGAYLAGVKVSAHDLRRGGATYVHHVLGIDLFKIQQIGGWDSLDVLRGYIQEYEVEQLQTEIWEWQRERQLHNQSARAHFLRRSADGAKCDPEERSMHTGQI